MIVNSKEERYDLLDNNAGGYYIATYVSNGKMVKEPIYFVKHSYDDERGHWWLEAPCCYMEYPTGDEDGFETYLKDMGCIEYMGLWFEIDCPQCAPFLPECVDLVRANEKDVLKYLLGILN